MKRLLSFLILLVALPSFAQLSRYDNFVWTTINGPGGQMFSPVAGASIYVCAYPANATPCTNLATVYSDPTGLVPITQPILSNAQGTFGFWAASANYQYTVTTVQAISFGPYSFSVGLGSISVGTAGQQLTTNPGATAAIWQSKPSADVRDFATSDMGAKINAAYGGFVASGGTAIVPGQATCYNQSTPVVLSTVNKYAIVQGVGAGGGDPSNPGTSCLNYVPTTATTALTLDFVPAGTSPHNPGAGIRDLVLINNNCFTVGGCGSSATGVKIGVNNGGLQDGSFRNFKAVGFAVGIDHNVNSNADSWGSTCDNCVLESNGIGFRTTATEAFSFIGGKFIFNTTGVSSTNANLKFYSTHFDSLGTAIVANGGNVDLVAPHFENYPNFGTHYFTGTANLKIYGGDAIDDVAIGNTDYWFTTTSSSVIDGLSIGSGGRTVTNLGICSGACDWKFINSAPATLTAASVCPDSTAVNCEIIIPSTNTIKKSISELTIGGTGNTPNARLTVNYNSGTETGFGFTNKAASGRSWALGDGVGAGAGIFGLYDVTGAALRFSVTASGLASAAKFGTFSNCSSSAAPAVCASAPAGSVVVAAAGTTVTVNTTAVTANSQILLTRDNSLGTKLSVTCNTQSSLVLGTPYVSARTAGTSFTITIDVGPTTDPMCISYSVIN